MSIGQAVTYRGAPYRIVGMDTVDGVLVCWLRVDGGRHFATAAATELVKA